MSDPGKLIDAIEAHLAAYPMAADSAEGVALSWLAAQGVFAESTREVELALEMLVRRRRLRQVKLADGSTLYSAGSELPRT